MNTISKFNVKFQQKIGISSKSVNLNIVVSCSYKKFLMMFHGVNSIFELIWKIGCDLLAQFQ